jgi:hypothetical protein
MSGRFAEELRLIGREIVTSGRAIARLGIGQAADIRAFSNDVAATRRSFVTAILSLPIFILFHVLDWAAGLAPLDPPRLMVIDLLTFPISWAGFALVSIPLVRMLGAEPQWPRSLPSVLHVPAIASETCALVGYGWALWLEWFVTRLVLNISPTAAALLVAVDVGFSAAISLMTLIPWQSLSLG